MKKRVLALLLASAIVSTLIIGCGNTPKPNDSMNQKEVEETKGPEKKTQKPDYDWSDKDFVKNVPFPDTDLTVIESETDSLFWVNANGSEDDFKNYVKQCKEAGFTIDANDWSDGYNAYDKNGERIDIRLDGTQYSITVNKTHMDSTFDWPTNGLATLIPKPQSTIGEMTTDSTDYFGVYVCKISPEDFKSYIKACEEKGFKYDYMKDENFFQARNSNGDLVSLTYGGVKTMHINMMSKTAMGDDWVPPTE